MIGNPELKSSPASLPLGTHPLPLWALTLQAPQASPAVIAVWGGQPEQHALVAHGPEAVGREPGLGLPCKGERNMYTLLRQVQTPWFSLSSRDSVSEVCITTRHLM